MVQSWMNSDGLYLKYGVDKTTPNNGGEYRNTGQIREVEVKITLANLTQTETILNDQIILPAGIRILNVLVLTETAAATGTAIDVGTIKTDRTTQGDYDGFLAAFPTGSMNQPGLYTELQEATTYNGALIGTTTTYDQYISASMTDATAFTGGVIYVKIRYYRP